MIQYNTLSAKLPTFQLNRLRSGIKNGTYKLLLTNTQVSKLPKAFANSSSANTKLSKT